MRCQFIDEDSAGFGFCLSLIEVVELANYVLLPDARLESRRNHALGIERHDFLKVEYDYVRDVLWLSDLYVLDTQSHIFHSEQVLYFWARRLLPIHIPCISKY